MKIEQFFKGVDKYDKVLAWLEGDINEIPITKDEFNKIIKNSTEIFRNSSKAEFDELNKDLSVRIVLHWIVGNNTDEFFKMK